MALPTIAQIDKIYYEYDQTKNGEQGYMFHANCAVHGKQNKTINFSIFIFDENGNSVETSSELSTYRTTSGKICTWADDVATYEGTRWSDMTLFLPYSAMKKMKRGETYYYQLHIRDKNNNYALIHASEKAKLTEWERHYASFDSIQISSTTQNNQQGFRIRGKLSIAGNFGNEYQLLFQFYDQNKQPITGTMSNYRTSGTSPIAAVWRSGYVPTYMYTLWTDKQAVFIPYDAIGYAPSRQYYYKYWIRKTGDNSETLYISDYLALNTVVNNYSKPTVTWLSSLDTQSSKTYHFKAGIKSSSQIQSTTITINGQALRGFKVVNNDGYDMTINEPLTLAEGNNTIRLSIVNAGGETTIERSIYCAVSQQLVETPQNRLALVIGNANYPSQRLSNPVNDANDVAAKLKTLGFDVLLLTDATKRQMEEKIQEFGAKAADYEVALFYYAGHGIQYKGRNFLIPVNVELNSPSDIEYDCTEANRVLAKMEEAQCQTNIVVLDACRNNPFERSWSRGVENYGLSTMNAPRGSLIAYATSPGSVAQDGKTRNSPYTAAFLQALDIPGMSIYEFFPYVSGLVQDATGNAQVPWISSSVSGKFYFNHTK